MDTTLWTTRKDRYGRSAQDAFSLPSHRVIGSVVKVPHQRVWISNDWSIRGPQAAEYHTSLADAKARLERVALAAAQEALIADHDDNGHPAPVKDCLACDPAEQAAYLEAMAVLADIESCQGIGDVTHAYLPSHTH